MLSVRQLSEIPMITKILAESNRIVLLEQDSILSCELDAKSCYLGQMKYVKVGTN